MQHPKEKSKRAPVRAMGMTVEDSVKPWSRGGRCSSCNRVRLGTGPHRHQCVRGQQPNLVPRGTKPPVLCRAGVRVAANACGRQCGLQWRPVLAACAQSIPKTSGIAQHRNIGRHSGRQARAATTCLSQWEAVDGDLTESSLPQTRLCHLAQLYPMTPTCGHPPFTIHQPQHLQCLC